MLNNVPSVFDSDSFVQTFAYAVGDGGDSGRIAQGDGVITGYASIDERLVFTAIQQSEFMNGAFGRIHAQKIADIIDMAIKRGAPFIMFMNTSGARIEEGFGVLDGYGRVMKALSSSLGQIPTICVIEGQCYGAAATLASLFDFTFMIKGKSLCSINTAEQLKAQSDYAGIAEDVSGATVNATQTGLCAVLADSKEELYTELRRFITFLPDNAVSGAPHNENISDDPNRRSSYCQERVLSTTETTGSDVRKVIADISDNSSYFELWSEYAPNIVVAFAEFDGNVTGIIANQPTVMQGKLNSDACRKAVAMIDFCDKFSIPILTLTDCPGICADADDEKRGLASHTAALASSFANTDIVKINIIIGSAYGNGAVLMNSRQLGADYIYAWDSADMNVITPEAGALITYRDEITSSDDPVKARTEAINKYRRQYATPYYAAQMGFIDDIISPCDTRARIISILRIV